jgi:hypothetical protein
VKTTTCEVPHYVIFFIHLLFSLLGQNILLSTSSPQTDKVSHQYITGKITVALCKKPEENFNKLRSMHILGHFPSSINLKT